MSSPAEDLQFAGPAPPPASSRRIGIWSGLATVLLYFVLQWVMALLCGLAIGLGFGFWKGIEAGLHNRKPDPGAIARALQGNHDIKLLIVVAALGLTAVLTIWIVRRIWPALWIGAEPPGFGFIRPSRRIHLLDGVLAGLAALVLGSGLTALFTQGHSLHQDVRVMADTATPGLRILLFAVTVFLVPPVEELVFRGALLSGLMQRMRAGWAILLSALIFGCVHLPDFKFVWAPIPALVLLGLLLAWLRVRTRSIWPSIVAHATNNLLAVLIWLAAPHLHP